MNIKTDIDTSAIDIALSNVINEDKLMQTLYKAGALIEKSAKENLATEKAWDTGNLARSIQARDPEKVDNNTYEELVTVDCEYGTYVEYGTGPIGAASEGASTEFPYTMHSWVWYSPKNNKFYTSNGVIARPYLRPAVDQNINNIKDLFKNIGGK